MQIENHVTGSLSSKRISPAFTVIALCVFLTALAAMLLLQYGMSGRYSVGVAVANSSGSWHWREFWHVPERVVSDGQFAAVMRVCLITVWAAYGAFLTLLRLAPISGRTLTAIAAVAAVAAALFFPPTLSADSYLYSGYGRMLVIYHKNPYVTGTDLLAQKHDPVAMVLGHGASTPAEHMYWSAPSVYGPVWTAVEAASAAAGRLLGIAPQIIFLKLVAAGFLMIAAFGSRRLAAMAGTADPRIAFAAVAFNPLLIIEGPGEAHNDLMVVACIILSLLFARERRSGIAGLFLGLAAGIKLFPLLLIPWIVAGMRSEGSRFPVRKALIFCCAAALPVVAGYGAFWRGLDTFASLRQNFVNTQHVPALTLLVYAALTVWVVLRRDALPAAWAIFATWLALYVPQIPYPWYLSWGLAVSVCGMDPRRMKLALALSTIALMSELHAYTAFG